MNRILFILLCFTTVVCGDTIFFSNDLTLECDVVRVNDDGIALEFISMGHESFLFLQTTLLYEAEDPMRLGAEFVQSITFELESDENDKA